MNKKNYGRIAIVVILIVTMALLAFGCKKDAAADTTAPNTEPTETTVPVTTGPGTAFNDLAEPKFDFTEPEEEANENTAPTEAESEETTAPADGETQPTAEAMTDYERYLNMSGEEQTAFIESFGSVEEFFAWLNKAQAEHEAQKPGVDIGSGSVDLGGLVGGNG